MAKKDMDKAGLELGLQLLSLSLADTQRATNKVLDSIIHCKDCIRWDKYSGDCGLHCKAEFYFTTKATDFCSYAKRKEQT